VEFKKHNYKILYNLRSFTSIYILNTMGMYILFIHQQEHFLLNLEKFSFTLEKT